MSQSFYQVDQDRRGKYDISFLVGGIDQAGNSSPPRANNSRQAGIMGTPKAKRRKGSKTDNEKDSHPRNKRSRKLVQDYRAILSNCRFCDVLQASTIIVRASDLQGVNIDDACQQAISQHVVVWLDNEAGTPPKHLRTIKFEGRWSTIYFQRVLYPPGLIVVAREIFHRTPCILTFNTAQPSEFSYRQTTQCWFGNSAEHPIVEIMQFLMDHPQVPAPLTMDKRAKSFKTMDLPRLLQTIEAKSRFHRIQFALHVLVFYRKTRTLRKRFLGDIQILKNITVLCDTRTTRAYINELKGTQFTIIEPIEETMRPIEGFLINDQSLRRFESNLITGEYSVLLISSGAGARDDKFRIWECGKDSAVVIAPLEPVGRLLRSLAKKQSGVQNGCAEADTESVVPESDTALSPRSCSVEI